VAVLQHKLTLGEAADLLSRALPGHRVEILRGEASLRHRRRTVRMRSRCLGWS
jgi:hypothetical protein